MKKLFMFAIFTFSVLLLATGCLSAPEIITYQTSFSENGATIDENRSELCLIINDAASFYSSNLTITAVDGSPVHWEYNPDDKYYTLTPGTHTLMADYHDKDRGLMAEGLSATYNFLPGRVYWVYDVTDLSANTVSIEISDIDRSLEEYGGIESAGFTPWVEPKEGETLLIFYKEELDARVDGVWYPDILKNPGDKGLTIRVIVPNGAHEIDSGNLKKSIQANGGTMYFDDDYNQIEKPVK